MSLHKGKTVGSSLKFKVHSPTIEEAAYTTTSAIFSMGLTLFTLSALYQGMHNIPLTTNKHLTLKSLVFLCLLVPIVAVYYAKMALEDYYKSSVSQDETEYLGEEDSSKIC